MKPKISTLIILLAAANTSLFSQPTIADQKTIGGSNGEQLNDCALTKDGGLILGGYSSSNKSGDKTQNCKGGTDYWIVKLDNKNNIEWDKTIGGGNTDYLTCLRETTDGGYILAGNSLSKISGDKTEDNLGREDYWVVKTNSTGKIQWQNTIGGSSLDYLSTMQQTDDGGYILGGQSFSNISYDKSEHRKGNSDYWIVKLDSSGNIKWDKTIGGNGYDNLYSLVQTPDGGYILDGISYSGISGDKTQANKGALDIWVVKTDASGAILWDKSYGGTGDDQSRAIRKTTDGGFIIGAESDSKRSGDKSQSGNGKRDYWIIKTDDAGNIQWDKTIGGSGDEIISGIKQTYDGGYIISGSSTSGISGNKTQHSRGGWDYWVVKLTDAGKFEWDKTIGGSLPDFSANIKEISRDHYVIGGYSYSGISGDKTDTLRGFGDYWIVYLNYTKPAVQPANSIAGTKVLINKDFSVYPNPAKDVLHVQTNGKATISVSDQSGKTMLTKIIDGNGTIDVSKLIPGIYYTKNNNTGSTQKMIVTK